ncbi:hypothetical protein [Aurantiacibacter gangjinensis]|uniref:Uncharacterized protein n=1 Tax=Aurantiacibacter gangjinensis TaxID=502682 RepID=A0A0G9MPF4_9SPHN|nr:hypothetical protein [Aurantiacibacter gangjinensis]APE28377.1 hypothetical protein BMF35_a1548 [Aurantiacibacter gangjinensis]KLE32605.1 hypothetical protein AAW01_00610 [Aurantiacibacter gangjinensis]
MKLWMIVLMAGALWGLNLLYDVATGRSGGSVEDVGALCRERMLEAGQAPADSDAMCNCLERRVTDWHEANPGGDYSRDVHERIVMQCAQWG